MDNNFNNNTNNIENEHFNNVNFQNNQVNGQVNQDNNQLSNNEQQNRISVENYSNQINGNKNSKNDKKKLMIIIGIIIAVVLVLALIKLLGSNSGDGAKELSKKASNYDKICTLSQDYQGQANINMTFGLYQKENQVIQDTVIIWESKNGKINITDGNTKEDVVSTFATITGMMISFDGGTVSNVKNYYKNGKVYLTNTRTYNSNEFSSVDMLAEDLISSGATCK